MVVAGYEVTIIIDIEVCRNTFTLENEVWTVYVVTFGMRC